jgi:predicted dehydrogenase
MEPLDWEAAAFEPADPLILQIDHFARVIRRQEAPVVSGREGMKTLAVIEAVKQAARTGGAVRVAA